MSIQYRLAFKAELLENHFKFHYRAIAFACLKIMTVLKMCNVTMGMASKSDCSQAAIIQSTVDLLNWPVAASWRPTRQIYVTSGHIPVSSLTGRLAGAWFTHAIRKDWKAFGLANIGSSGDGDSRSYETKTGLLFWWRWIRESYFFLG